MPEHRPPRVGQRAHSRENAAMDTNSLFTMALGLQAPWEVKNLQFDEEAKRLDITIDFTRGANFPCPVCGQPAKVHDTEEKTWRHLDFFQHAAYLTARVPRCKCDVDGVKQVKVPWARPGSGFTLLFEALIMTLVQAMPVASVAKLVGEHDTKLWRLLHHHVDEARAKVDMSEVTRIGIDETAAQRGHNYITLAMDMEEKKGSSLFKVGDRVAVRLPWPPGSLVRIHSSSPLTHSTVLPTDQGSDLFWAARSDA